MKTDQSRFPFARSARGARWPSDIPHRERRRWKDSRKNFSAVWRVPAGMGFDDLRIELPRHFMVLVVDRGAIRLSHGAREVCLVTGQAVAVSVREVLVEVPFSARGESVFQIHLFSRMPTMEKLGTESPLAMMVRRQATHVSGLFPYRNAAALLNPGLYGGKLMDNAVELVWRLYVCGLQSTVRFVASGQDRSAEERSRRVPCTPLLVDPVAALT